MFHPVFAIGVNVAARSVRENKWPNSSAWFSSAFHLVWSDICKVCVNCYQSDLVAFYTHLPHVNNYRRVPGWLNPFASRHWQKQDWEVWKRTGSCKGIYLKIQCHFVLVTWLCILYKPCCLIKYRMSHKHLTFCMLFRCLQRLVYNILTCLWNMLGGEEELPPSK